MGRGPGVRVVGPEAIQIDFRWKGQRCRERLRLRPTAANLKFAANLKARIEHEIATGTFEYQRYFPESPKARSGEAGAQSLANTLSNYLGSIEGSVQPETLREYRQAADAIVKGIGNPRIDRLSRADVRNYLAASPLSKKRLDNILIPLRGALAQAVDDGILAKNPLDGFKFRRVSPKREIDPFTREEIDALGETSLGNLWVFWAWTGLRSGELIGLRWQDVEAGGRNIAIRSAVRLGRRKAPKTQAGSRVLCLLEPARIRLPERPAGDVANDPVWINPNTGKDWHEAKALARAFRKACKEAGVRYRYVYQLRHSFASMALSSGENPLWVSAYMGHRDRSMVWRTYGRWMPDADPLAGSRMVESKARRGQQAA